MLPNYSSPGIHIEMEAVLAPDIIMPGQYADMLRSELNGPQASEKRLCLAILEDAIASLKYRDAGRRKVREMYYEALAWITLPDSDGALLTFDGICEALSIDADYLRKGILAALAHGALQQVGRRSPVYAGDKQRPTANRSKTRYDRRRRAAEYA